jgi:hypothetical protein
MTCTTADTRKGEGGNNMNVILEMINELETVNKELANQADELKREIDRLTAMLPKVIKPYIAGYESDGSPVICECGWIVGIMEDYKVLDTDEYPRHNYCGKCGAKIDWITFEA